MRAAFGAVAVALALALVWGTKEASSALPADVETQQVVRSVEDVLPVWAR